jgi:hypothetical protein
VGRQLLNAHLLDALPTIPPVHRSGISQLDSEPIRASENQLYSTILPGQSVLESASRLVVKIKLQKCGLQGARSRKDQSDLLISFVYYFLCIKCWHFFHLLVKIRSKVKNLLYYYNVTKCVVELGAWV